MVEELDNNVARTSSKLNTKIIHKRGVYDPSIISKLRDGEVFYDITGTQGIFIGIANSEGDIDIVKIAGPGGGITPEEWELVVKKTDIVREIDEQAIYDINSVLGANAGKALKILSDEQEIRISLLEKLFEEKLDEVVEAKVIEVLDRTVGSNSIQIVQDPQTGRSSISVHKNDTLTDIDGSLGTCWIEYR